MLRNYIHKVKNTLNLEILATIQNKILKYYRLKYNFVLLIVVT